MYVTAVTPFLVDPGTGKNWLFVKVDTSDGIGSSALNRGHEHQRSTRRLSAREGRPRCLGRGQRGGGT
jgi:hypothetical protein